MANFDKYLSMKRMNMTKYVLGIYHAKFDKYLMSSVFVVWSGMTSTNLNCLFCILNILQYLVELSHLSAHVVKRKSIPNCFNGKKLLKM